MADKEKKPEFPASGQLESENKTEFPASGQLESEKKTEFPAAGNSKIGELEAGNLGRGTWDVPISGGTYFITVQQVLEKLYIHKTKLLLNLNVDVSSFNVLSVAFM